MRYRSRQPIVIGALITLVIALMAGASLVLAAPTPPPYRGCGGVAEVPIIDQAQMIHMLALLNAEREKASHANPAIKPLTRVVQLETAAMYHATDEGYDNYRDHTTHDPSGPVPNCGMEQRIKSYYATNWWAEVIHSGSNAEDTVAWWMNSSNHRPWILKPELTGAGVGYYLVGTSPVWVVDFGEAQDPGPTATPTATPTKTPTATVGPPPPSPTDGPVPTDTTVPTNVPDPTHPPQNERVYLPLTLRG